MNDECLFCKLYREGDHVAATDGFVAIRDINPQAPVHLLVLPERHVDSFREIGEFPPEEAMRMLEFVADVPWVHLDIAEAGWSSKDDGEHTKGATGAGVRTLIELLATW